MRKLTALLALVVLPAAAVASAAPMGTAFTYQGRLANAGAAVSGSYDFEFKLFDAPTLGNQVGSTDDVASLSVSGGLFTVNLDFGAPAFAGETRWLEVAVRQTGSPNPYTILTPRQPLTPAPYSVFSSYTDAAHLTNLNASNLTTGTVPSGQLTGTYTSPLAFSNPGNSFVGDGSGLTNLNAQAKLRRTIVVSPVGSSAANGTALLTALAGITPSATDQWLIKLEPGIYDVGAAGALVMKQYCDIEGSGEPVTKITAAGIATNTAGTIQVVNNSELRHVTIENRGGAAYARALWINGTDASARVTHVTVTSSGGTAETQGYFADGNAAATVTDLTARVTASAGNSYALLDVGGRSSMTNVQASATGGGGAFGYWICCGSAPTLRNVVATATGGTGGSTGIVVFDTSAPTLENVYAMASGGSPTDVGISLTGSSTALLQDRKSVV